MYIHLNNCFLCLFVFFLYSLHSHFKETLEKSIEMSIKMSLLKPHNYIGFGYPYHVPYSHGR